MRIEQARRVVPACLLFVSGGILFAGSFSVLPPAAISPVVFSFLSPTGYFLSIAKESTQRTPAETDGFCTSFSFARAVV